MYLQLLLLDKWKAADLLDMFWEVGNPEKPHARFSTELKGHTVTIEKVAFNPVKDAELCSVDSDGVVKFWDVRTKNCINEVRGLGQAFTLTWAPNGESLVVGNKVDTWPTLFDLKFPQQRLTVQPTRRTKSLSFHQPRLSHYHLTNSHRRQTKFHSAGAVRSSLWQRAMGMSAFSSTQSLNHFCFSLILTRLESICSMGTHRRV